eukprot:CAMPEP_0119527854 /NCGR_PEP_ID=MMETSP1344-20130328/42166_1 /TAXON_ID=236787 /ORGANISM="Florenciella parvula, Strain CCMP2471" /LENGTH=104 /DNA_ID=CAMNT_0007567113 /DNA_START=271 /DNA_END=582 /DNA_ORIENTATION=+
MPGSTLAEETAAAGTPGMNVRVSWKAEGSAIVGFCTFTDSMATIGSLSSAAGGWPWASSSGAGAISALPWSRRACFLSAFFFRCFSILTLLLSCFFENPVRLSF